MLVLTRRPEQGIHLGSDIRIVVISVSGDQVRLGIDAPPDKAILRDEIFERVALANSEAASNAPSLPKAIAAPTDGAPGEGRPT